MLNEGTQVWRPMEAEKLKENIYKIESYPTYDPIDEELKFNQGDIVNCERRKFGDKELLVAISFAI